MSVDNVYPKVRQIIADVLVVDESEVELKKRLVVDLGAESIDFLDLIFQLEQEFKVKIPRGQLEQEARQLVPEGEFEVNGTITKQGIEALKQYMPEVPAEYFHSDMKVNDIPTLFTVETCCKFVLNARSKQADAAVSLENNG